MKAQLSAVFLYFACGHAVAANVFPSLPTQKMIRYITAEEPRADPSYTHFEAFRIKPSDVRSIIHTYRQVSRQDWLTHYQHVMGGDRYGWIILKGGAKIRWMVRPGALCLLTFSDGRTAYLVLGPNAP